MLILPKLFLKVHSLDLNPLDFHVWGAMLVKYNAYVPKPTNKTKLRVVLEAIWDDLPQESSEKAVVVFRKRLQTSRADGGHFEHLFP